MELLPCPLCGMTLLPRGPKLARHPANAECAHSNIHVWEKSTQDDVYDFERWNTEAVPVVPPSTAPATVTQPTLGPINPMGVTNDEH